MTMQTRFSLAALFITSSIIWISGNGILPLLPVYAETLGANNFEIGLYLAFSYTCLAVGALVATKSIHTHSQAKQVLIITGALSVPITFSLGHVSSLGELIAFTSFIWMLGGAGFSALNSLVARFTTQQHRGKIMGALAITSPIGSVIGGSISGPIVDASGFDTLFLTLAWINLLWPISGLFIKSSHSKSMPTTSISKRSRQSGPITFAIQRQQWNYQLIIATSLSYMSYYVALLATSITMKDAGFTATDISSTAIIGGLAAIPFIYSISHASDALGRKALWVFCNLTGAVALLLLAMAETLITFWAVAFMIRCLSSGSRSIGSAWMIDLCQQSEPQPPHKSTALKTPSMNFLKHYKQESVQGTRRRAPVFSEEKALALISATPWIGGILGYLLYGGASLSFTSSSLLMMAVSIPLLSIGLVLSISPPAASTPDPVFANK